LNVALTRAQKKLILVGNASALEKLPVFERLLAYCRGLNTIIPFATNVAPHLAGPPQRSVGEVIVQHQK
jgi:hypothetical protein